MREALSGKDLPIDIPSPILYIIKLLTVLFDTVVLKGCVIGMLWKFACCVTRGSRKSIR